MLSFVTRAFVRDSRCGWLLALSLVTRAVVGVLALLSETRAFVCYSLLLALLFETCTVVGYSHFCLRLALSFVTRAFVCYSRFLLFVALLFFYARFLPLLALLSVTRAVVGYSRFLF